MISIQKLGQYADAGDEVRLLSDSESDGDGTRIFIQVHRPIETETDAAWRSMWWLVRKPYTQTERINDA